MRAEPKPVVPLVRLRRSRGDHRDSPLGAAGVTAIAGAVLAAGLAGGDRGCDAGAPPAAVIVG